MSEERLNDCPDCTAPGDLNRRDFARYLSIGSAFFAASGAGLLSTRSAHAEPELVTKPRLYKNPAEDLVRELFSGMTDDQKKAVCRPFEDPARLAVNPNRALDKTIGMVYSKAQQELIEKIVKAISSGDDKGWTQITRRGTWDASKTFTNTGANIFGDPVKGKFAFLFTGHHLTMRCDGDSMESTAFGGPIYYGHTPNGYSDKNVFSYQTEEVMKAFDALDEKQRTKALVKKGNPGEGPKSIELKKEATRPGISISELSKDQQELIGRVMRQLLSPFRAEDADEVMRLIKESGGMEKIHLAFYNEEYENEKTSEKQPWSFWRLDGPGFVWNYRVLPHVHTFVNIRKI
jgi:hypothetical protein